MVSILNLITININEDICQKLKRRGKTSRLCQLWHPNTQKLCHLDKKCIELDLCILIRRTILYSVIISPGSILTKIYGKNMHFGTCFFATFGGL